MPDPDSTRISPRHAATVPGAGDLVDAPLTVVGRLLEASNVAVLVRLGDGPAHAIYKPVAGERPLWDFPDGHLAHREVAAWLVCAAGGWDVVPPTVLREGPFGPGSVQAWVNELPDGVEAVAPKRPSSDDVSDADDADRPAAASGQDDRRTPLGEPLVTNVDDEDDDAVRLFPPAAVPAGWRAAFSGELSNGMPVVVAHADSPRLRSLAVLDAVLNNSDRKGSHILSGLDGQWYGIDHGLTCHEDDKLRTVLWGWAGEPLPPDDLDRLRRLRSALGAGASAPHGSPLVERLDRLLTVPEVEALIARLDRLIDGGTHPHPSDDWPAIPWPAL